MTDAYYLPVGDDRFVATGHTVGPWADGVQHMGPPSALLARAMLRCSPREDTALAKLTVDILGPVPRAEVRVTATVLRPGRTIELIGAELSAGSIVAARATGWRLIRTDTGELAGGTPEPLPPPEAGGPRPLPASWMVGGYLSSIVGRAGGRRGVGSPPVRAGGRRADRRAVPTPDGRRLGQRDVGQARPCALVVPEHRPHRSPAPDAPRRLGRR
jgi:hypothetical protein